MFDIHLLEIFKWLVRLLNLKANELNQIPSIFGWIWNEFKQINPKVRKGVKNPSIAQFQRYFDVTTEAQERLNKAAEELFLLYFGSETKRPEIREIHRALKRLPGVAKKAP